MFADASALAAILLKESDGDALARRLLSHSRRVTSPLAVWETAMAVRKGLDVTIETAGVAVENLLQATEIEIQPIPADAWRLALQAHERFGKGRHAAALNFGDCFAYACARLAKAPLLYKGDDFALTDIERA